MENGPRYKRGGPCPTGVQIPPCAPSLSGVCSSTGRAPACEAGGRGIVPHQSPPDDRSGPCVCGGRSLTSGWVLVNVLGRWPSGRWRAQPRCLYPPVASQVRVLPVLPIHPRSGCSAGRLARLAGGQEVTGSNPVIPTVCPFGHCGCGFRSVSSSSLGSRLPWVRRFRAVGLVCGRSSIGSEHQASNLGVAGSSPADRAASPEATFSGCGSVWLERHVRDVEAASSNLAIPTLHRSLGVSSHVLCSMFLSPTVGRRFTRPTRREHFR